MKHFMIDLETLDTQPTAAFHEIGWCGFDLDSNDTVSGSILVDPQSCIDIGMTVSWSTIAWWLVQDQEARENMARDGIPLLDALKQLSDIYKFGGYECPWSHGLTFDIPILNTAYHRLHMKEPWDFYMARDTRTVFMLEAPKSAPNKFKHSAEHDAIHQVKMIKSSLKGLGR